MATTKSGTTAEIEIIGLDKGRATYHIVGTSPLLCNRLSEKAKRELLLPGGPRRGAARAESLKHVPLQEYRDSPYTLRDGEGPTRLALLSSMFKKSLTAAALRTPGATKTELGQLVQPIGNRLPLYGRPELYMAIVRSADMNHTPDVRTRAILPEWACEITFEWVAPQLREKSITNLLARAGFFIGVGDYRPEKGAGSYGQFRIADVDDPDLRRIRDQGVAVQDAALAEPTFHDADTEDLFAWFTSEVGRRGLEGPPSRNGIATPEGVLA